MTNPDDLSHPVDGLLPDEPQMIQAVQEYLKAVESGNRPNRAEFLDSHAEIADSLANYLDALDFVQVAAPRLDGSAADGGPAASAAPLLPPLTWRFLWATSVSCVKLDGEAW